MTKRKAPARRVSPTPPAAKAAAAPAATPPRSAARPAFDLAALLAEAQETMSPEAFDRFKFLLSFPANRERLRTRAAHVNLTGPELDATVEALASRPYHRHFWPEGKRGWAGCVPELGVNVKHPSSHRLCVKLLEDTMRRGIRELLNAGRPVRDPDTHVTALESPEHPQTLKKRITALEKQLQNARATILICKGLLIEKYPDDSWVAQRIAETLIEIQGIGRAQMNLMFGYDRETGEWSSRSNWTHSDDDRRSPPRVETVGTDTFALAT